MMRVVVASSFFCRAWLRLVIYCVLACVECCMFFAVIALFKRICWWLLFVVSWLFVCCCLLIGVCCLLFVVCCVC